MCRNSGAEKGMFKEREKRSHANNQPADVTGAVTRLFTGFEYPAELKAVLVDGERNYLHELDASWTHRTVCVNAVDPVHRLDKPEAPTGAFTFDGVLSGFDRGKRCQEALAVALVYFQCIFQHLECKVCFPQVWKEGTPE